MVHTRTQSQSDDSAGTCDFCNAVLPPPHPKALVERRFCCKAHKEAYWTKARIVGDAALTTAKSLEPAA